MLKELCVERPTRYSVKFGPHSNEDVILHLIKFKCMPLLLYGTKACPLSKAADVQSLDFTVMRFLMKLFESSNRDFVLSCIGYFNFSLPGHLISKLTSLRSWTNLVSQFINFISSCSISLCL
jgi:hypothetical protein